MSSNLPTYAIRYRIEARDESMSGGYFQYSVTTPLIDTQGIFSCDLFNDRGEHVEHLDAQNGTVLAPPSKLDGFKGKSFTAKFNYQSSGLDDIVVPVPFPDNNFKSMNRRKISFFWLQLPEQPGQTRNITTSSPDYFTSFEVVPGAGFTGFIGYVDWLDDESWAINEKPAQSDTFAVTGKYSCLLQEDTLGWLGTAHVQTKKLPLPFNPKRIMVAFWARGVSGNPLEYTFSIDGSVASSQSVSFEVADVGHWVERQMFCDVPAGAKNFKYRVDLLKASSGAALNNVWIDDLSITFIYDSPDIRMKSKLVFTSYNCTTYILDAETGEIKNSFKVLDIDQVTSPLIDNNKAYAAGILNGQACVYAFDITTGRQLWNGPCLLEPAVPSRGAPRLGILEETVYAVAESGTLYALRGASGVIDWQLNVLPGGQEEVKDITLALRVAYISSSNGVYAVSLDKRRLIWSYITSSLCSKAAIQDGLAYFCCANNNLYAVDAMKGNLKWNNSLPAVNTQGETSVSLGLALEYGSVYAGTGALCGFTAQEGFQKWVYSIPPSYVTKPAVSNRMLCFVTNYTSSSDGALRGLDAISGKERWKFSVPGKRIAGDAMAVDDTVYCTTEGGNTNQVYAVDISTGEQRWASSQLEFSRLGNPPVLHYAIPVTDLSRRYDQCAYLMAHNAFANIDDGWFSAQQTSSIPKQLERGVRGLMIDIFKTKCVLTEELGAIVQSCGPDAGGDFDIYLIHESLQASAPIKPLSFFKRLIDTLGDIKLFLDNNPKEVVTIIFESQVDGDSALLKKTFVDSGIADYIFFADPSRAFYADAAKAGSVFPWDVGSKGWPTLQWMIDHGKRLVVFSDHRKKDDGLPKIWNFAVENDYGNKSLAGGCQARKGSVQLNDRNKALFVMNHFPTFSMAGISVAPGRNSYWTSNDYYVLMAQLTACDALAGRLPNFVAVDFFELGNNGGPAKVVEDLNKEWARRSS